MSAETARKQGGDNRLFLRHDGPVNGPLSAQQPFTCGADMLTHPPYSTYISPCDCHLTPRMKHCHFKVVAEVQADSKTGAGGGA
jgi:hypothetical protein